jgi:hypothetical protein
MFQSTKSHRQGTSIRQYCIKFVDRDSSVGIATRCWLDGPGIESRWGARFSAPVQTGPGAHPASCAVGTESFPGGKKGVALNTHPRVALRLPLLPALGLRGLLSGELYFHFTFLCIKLVVFQFYAILLDCSDLVRPGS